MDSILSIRRILDNWLASDAQALALNGLAIEIGSIGEAAAIAEKGVIRVVHAKFVGQIDIWGSGEVDVMHVRLADCKESASHYVFSTDHELVEIVNSGINEMIADSR